MGKKQKWSSLVANPRCRRLDHPALLYVGQNWDTHAGNQATKLCLSMKTGISIFGVQKNMCYSLLFRLFWASIKTCKFLERILLVASARFIRFFWITQGVQPGEGTSPRKNGGRKKKKRAGRCGSALFDHFCALNNVENEWLETPVYASYFWGLAHVEL